MAGQASSQMARGCGGYTSLAGTAAISGGRAGPQYGSLAAVWSGFAHASRRLNLYALTRGSSLCDAGSQ